MSFRTKALGIAAALAVATPFIAKYEGLSLSAYLDPISKPTICYGHTEGVKLGQIKTVAECDRLLKADLGRSLAVVDRAVTVPLPHTRRAALASFAYNVGEGAFLRSTLLRRLNAGDVVGACNQLSRWVYARGIKWPGLVRRREAERQLCLKGV